MIDVYDLVYAFKCWTSLFDYGSRRGGRNDGKTVRVARNWRYGCDNDRCSYDMAIYYTSVTERRHSAETRSDDTHRVYSRRGENYAPCR